MEKAVETGEICVAGGEELEGLFLIFLRLEKLF